MENHGRKKKGVTGLIVAALVVVAAALGAGLLAQRKGLLKATAGRGALNRAPVVLAGAAKHKQVNGHTARWSRKEAVTLSLDASLDQIGPGGRDAVRSALGAWMGSGVPLPDVQIDSISRPPEQQRQDGINGVYFAPIIVPGHEQDLAVTVSYVDDATGRINEADIILNANRPLGLLEPSGSDQSEEVPGCTAPFDAQSVATHELGHFFGLGEDLENRKATMFYKLPPCVVRGRAPAQDDTQSMTKLYEAPDADTEQAGAGCGSIAPRGLPRGGGACLAAVAAAAAWLSRRRSACPRGS